jgi:signal transduction histidine kinase
VPPIQSHLNRSDLRFGRTVLALVIAGFAAVMVAGGVAAYVMAKGQEQTSWVNHTFAVEREVAGIRLALEEMRSARRGSLLGLFEDSGSTYPQARASLANGIEQVAGLTRDNPAQQANVAALRRAAARFDRLFQAGLRPGANQVVHEEIDRQQTAQELESIAQRMLQIEQRLLARRIVDQQRLAAIFYQVLLAAGLLLVGVGAASLLVILRYTRDLAATRNQLRRLNANLEGAVRERTRDLQRANEEIQRFAYIVSHDLRSPLVNIMGFTSELEAAVPPLAALVDRAEAEAPTILTREARLAVSEDIPESLGFIRTSTKKMDRLINAILTLSRQGRRTLAAEPVALTQLAETVLGALRHQVDDRGATITIAPAMPTIVTDRLALEQILSNLIDNALKYLSPKRPGEIRVSASQHGRRTEIVVADNGRGIDPRDHGRVFDLFRRSGPQDQPGEGIGLAHVRALAYRLGGTIRVASEIDNGATFTVDLPTVYSPEKDSMT